MGTTGHPCLHFVNVGSRSVSAPDSAHVIWKMGLVHGSQSPGRGQSFLSRGLPCRAGALHAGGGSQSPGQLPWMELYRKQVEAPRMRLEELATNTQRNCPHFCRPPLRGPPSRGGSGPRGPQVPTVLVASSSEHVHHPPPCPRVTLVLDSSRSRRWLRPPAPSWHPWSFRGCSAACAEPPPLTRLLSAFLLPPSRGHDPRSVRGLQGPGCH